MIARIKKYSTLINFLIFQVCWFACVLGAANKMELLGPALVALTVPLQIYLLTNNYWAESFFVLICGCAGFLIETLFILGNVYIVESHAELAVCPPWMAALWFNFAMLVSISLRWLKGKYLLAALIGGAAGPLAYWGGDKLDALEVSSAFLAGYLPLAVVWAMILPLLVFLHTNLTFKEPKDPVA